MTIAIVDDSKITRVFHNMLVKRIDNKIDIQSYDSGESFLMSLEDDKIDIPDLVLTDFNMYELNGIDVINGIDSYCTKNALTKNPVVFLVSSNNELKSTQIKCSNDIYRGYIPKPLTRNHMIHIFTNMLLSL